MITTIWRRGLTVLLWATLASCAEPNPPLPAPLELVVISNSGDNSLSLLSVASSSSPALLQLSDSISGAAADGATLLAALPGRSALAVVDLRALVVRVEIPLPAGALPSGVAVVDDSIAYLTDPTTNSVIRVNYLDGTTASLAVGTYPQGVLATRGRVFVINGNMTACPGQPGLCPAGPSWLTVVDPVSNTLNQARDSIGLLGPGDARYGTVGGDGLLYVMSRGDLGTSRLSIVDPVGLEELASFGGFGDDPGQMASDMVERIFISSPTEGLMEFNTRTRTVVRGAGAGVAIPQNAGVTLDVGGRVYATVSGGCSGTDGSVTVLDSALAPVRSVTLGACAGLAFTARFPLEPAP